MTGPALALSGVSFSYGNRLALVDIDLEVQTGELVALLGTNGAGKSTLLRVLAGLLRPDAGRVGLQGRDVSLLGPRARVRNGLALVLGGRSVFADLTVREALLLSGTAAGYDRTMAGEVSRDALAEVPELAARAATRSGALSRGEQHLLALAQALIKRPRALLVDELSLNLAPAVVERVTGLIRALHADGATVVVADQSASLALRLAPRAVFLDAGRIRFDGPSAELRTRRDLLRSVFLTGAAT